MVNKSILYLFPNHLRELFSFAAGRQKKLQEIRLRTMKPICVSEAGKEYFLDRQGYYTEYMQYARILKAEELEEIIHHICQYSLYAYEDELKQGFLTVPGGHRIGVAGQAVTGERQEVRTLKYISSVNIRIAHEIKGAANSVLPYVYRGGRLQNTIIVSAPGCGKTTILRDLIRLASDGNAYGPGISIGVVDERSELAGCYHGCPQNDMGIRTDVLDSCPKAKGMLMLIRSMAPAAIAVDELGEVDEWKALTRASFCGTAVLATMHGEGLQDYKRRSQIYLQGQEDIFQVCIVLQRRMSECTPMQIYEKDEKGDWICRFQK